MIAIAQVIDAARDRLRGADHLLRMLHPDHTGTDLSEADRAEVYRVTLLVVCRAVGLIDHARLEESGTATDHGVALRRPS